MPGRPDPGPTRRRWWIVALLFAVTFVAYMDRVNFTVAVPAIRREYGFSLEQIGLITFAWSITYALFGVPGGWFADRLGLRRGMIASLGWWSAFTIASPFSAGLGAWIALRALMGAGEAPVWSFNAKTADEWMAPDERSSAWSLGGSGEFLGPALGALFTGLIAATLGWRWSFVLFGVVGLLLLPAWFVVVRDSPDLDPRLNDAERARIGHRSSATPSAPDWAGLRAVILSRTGLGLMLCFTASGYVLFTFRNWLPAYMHDQFGSSLIGGAVWTGVMNALGFAGFLLAGPANDWLVRRMDRLTARRLGTAVPGLLAAACLLASAATAHARVAWATVGLIGLSQLLCTVTAGAWATSVIDLSPGRSSTGLLYGWFNAGLNLCGAANALVIGFVADRLGFPAAFASAVLFLLLFVSGMVLVVDRPGYERLLRAAERSRSGGAPDDLVSSRAAS